MEWAIIVLIMMSLLGSMMWVMPSPRQRFLAKLRLEASRQGFHVQIVRVTPPRAAGQVAPEVLSATAYRLPRFNLQKSEREGFIEWQVFRQTAIADTGLPEGWCWGIGERCLSEAQLESINELIKKLPDGVSSIESTPVHLSLYWDERGDENSLEMLQQLMQPFMEQKF
ncbi:hypothetical protein [Amphritea sp.]|uniref:hypothetical protein n=1 Tax=Amphritea sp. TaxID=1872502 RepID=UPI0025C49EAF|nr:hypothetical protein [Amphritea sp.]